MNPSKRLGIAFIILTLVVLAFIFLDFIWQNPL